MAIDPRLTILLTLKGRDLYTLRWLWHANRIRLPFPVVIADGEVNPTVARLIEDPAVFPNLQIEYRRYNDLTFREFYLKLQDAISSIKTPYVMMSDNDDFLFPSGIGESLEWLERFPEYVSVGGAIGHFECAVEKKKKQWPNLTGKIERFWYHQSRAYRSYNLASQLAAERTCEAYSDFLTVWYNVFRVEALRKITEEMAELNFQKLDNSELYLILRTATLGKAKSIPSCMSYLRQLGTSSNPGRAKDFVVSLSNEPYIGEIQKIVRLIAMFAAEADATGADNVAERLRAISATRLRDKLVAVLGWRATVRGRLKKVLPQALTDHAKAFLEPFRSGRSSAAGGQPISRATLLQRVAKARAPAGTVDEMERELRDVEGTMQNGDFIAFLEAAAPELLRRENPTPYEKGA